MDTLAGMMDDAVLLLLECKIPALTKKQESEDGCACSGAGAGCRSNAFWGPCRCRRRCFAVVVCSPFSERKLSFSFPQHSKNTILRIYCSKFLIVFS